MTSPGPAPREDELDIESLLIEMGLENVVPNFRKEKISISTVSLLTDQQLSDLGVTTVGERVVLQKLCRSSLQDNAVVNEVNKIMGHSSSSRSYSFQTRSQLPTVARKPKRKNKSFLPSEKFKRACHATFQKKIVVFKYMPVNEFSRSEMVIIIRGLLPAISLSTTEGEVRQEICEVINANPSFCDVTTSDFEFLSVSGKQVSVPQCKKGFEWDGRAVKELAGSGSVYVRLTREYQIEKEIVDVSSESCDSDNGVALPHFVPMQQSSNGCCSTSNTGQLASSSSIVPAPVVN